MKMPSTPVLFGIGAAVVVVLVVISKLRSSGSSAAATTTATPTGSATGVDVGQLSSFESSLTSELDAWEAQQAAGSGSQTTPGSTTTSTSSPPPLPSSGATRASNPAPVVTSAKSSINLRTLGTLETEAQLAGLPGSLQANDLNPAYIVASERQAAKQGISLAQAYKEEVTNTVPGYA